MKLNKQFNRYEQWNSHKYISDLGDSERKKEVAFKGFIKCKLMHGMMGSVIVPDLLIYRTSKEKFFKWIQPLAFRANQIYFFDQNAIANLMIDISAKTTVIVKFKQSNFIRFLDDYSELYECEISASTDISDHFTGVGYFNNDFIPCIKSYHHTTQEAFLKIMESGFLKNSKWNIGGTKKLKNIGYVYFTPLDKLKYNEDLIQVAMSNKGFILGTTNDGRIRRINIYRRSTKDFEATLEFWIDTQAIATPHLLKRRDSLGGVFYLICSPFIHRVGLKPDSVLEFKDNVINDISKKADYIIVGNCDQLDGIIAPYDEENTEYIFKIEKTLGSQNLFSFWLEHANSDQYSDKAVEYQEFLSRNRNG